jgi:hypothetical protein
MVNNPQILSEGEYVCVVVQCVYMYVCVLCVANMVSILFFLAYILSEVEYVCVVV